MLVLSRKVGESILIDGQIEITVVAVNGSRTKVGIEAPDEVRILRSELSEWPEHTADCHLQSESRNRSNVLAPTPK